MTTPLLAKNELLMLVLHNHSSAVALVSTLPHLAAAVIDFGSQQWNCWCCDGVLLTS
jgi:hypothetical protein